ncbi:hypothetical protein D3C71_1309520 [compost metagenome]
MDWNKPFIMKNISGGKLVVGVISLKDTDFMNINPLSYPQTIIEKIERLHGLGKVLAQNGSFHDEGNETIVHAEDLKTAEDHAYTIFNPNQEKAVNTTPINSSNNFTVTNLLEESYENPSDYELMKAAEFLAQHWRKVEADVKRLTDIKYLEFLLKMANENNIAGKKVELIEEKIKELNS